MLIAIISDAFRSVKADMALERESGPSRFLKTKLHKMPITRHMPFLKVNEEEDEELWDTTPLLHSEPTARKKVLPPKELSTLPPSLQDHHSEASTRLLLQEILGRMYQLDDKLEALASKADSMDRQLQTLQHLVSSRSALEKKPEADVKATPDSSLQKLEILP
jgi:hypothetical protein